MTASQTRLTHFIKNSGHCAPIIIPNPTNAPINKRFFIPHITSTNCLCNTIIRIIQDYQCRTINIVKYAKSRSSIASACYVRDFISSKYHFSDKKTRAPHKAELSIPVRTPCSNKERDSSIFERWTTLPSHTDNRGEYAGNKKDARSEVVGQVAFLFGITDEIEDMR